MFLCRRCVMVSLTSPPLWPLTPCRRSWPSVRDLVEYECILYFLFTHPAHTHSNDLWSHTKHRLNVFTVNTLLLPQKQAAPTVLCLSSCTSRAGASAAPTFDLLLWFCFLFLSCHFVSLTCLVADSPCNSLLGHRDGGGRVTAAQVRCYTLVNTERPPPAEAPNTDAAAATQTSRRGDAWAGRVVSVLKESVKAPECQRWTWRCVNMCLFDKANDWTKYFISALNPFFQPINIPAFSFLICSSFHNYFFVLDLI